MLLLRVVAVAALLTAAACTDAADGSGGKLRIVTTVAPLTSIVASVAGDKAEIDGLVPEGADSHTFEPPPSAAKVLSRADIVIVNGLKLEEPTEKLARDTMHDGAELVELGPKVLPQSEYIYDFSFPREGGKPNPHLWTDPTYAIKYGAVVRDALAKKDPRNAAVYRANYDRFAAQARALDAALIADQQSVRKRELLTYHDAYAYFARTHGWTIIGAIQPKNFEDPSPREVAALIDQVRAQHVPVIFGSEVFPSKVLAEIGRATGARYEDTLRDDDLPGEPGTRDHSWFGLMRFDYTTMIRALGGNPSELAKLPAGSAPDRARYPQ